MTSKVWEWGDLVTDRVWMDLKFDPSASRYYAYRAVVFDEDGVEGYADADNPLDAVAIAHHRQKQNRIIFDKRK